MDEVKLQFFHDWILKMVVTRVFRLMYQWIISLLQRESKFLQRGGLLLQRHPP